MGDIYFKCHFDLELEEMVLQPNLIVIVNSITASSNLKKSPT